MGKAKAKIRFVFFLASAFALSIGLVRIWLFPFAIRPRVTPEQDFFSGLSQEIKTVQSGATTAMRDIQLSLRSIQDLNAPTTSPLTIDERLSPELADKFFNKMNEKNIAHLPAEIIQVRDHVPNQWDVQFNTLEPGIAPGRLAILRFHNTTTCEICIPAHPCFTAASELNVEAYPASLKDQIQTALSDWADIRMDGICQPQLMSETSEYVFVNRCSNELNCNTIDQLQESLKKYFASHQE